MRKFLYLSVWLSYVLLSCKKDDADPVPPPVVEVPDKEAPVIALVAPADPTQLVKGTLEIKATATDNKELAKVDLYIDGQLTKTFSTSPVEFSWDSKTTTDGIHDIKVVATDKEGNAAQITFKVEVLNVFMSFKVEADYLTPDINAKTYESWIFVSDGTGKTLGVSQMKNGETIKFPTPEGFTKEKKYNFTKVSYRLSKDIGFGEDAEYELYTYSNIAFGEYRFALEPVSKPRQNLGTFSVTINNYDYIPEDLFSNRTKFSGAGVGDNSFSIANSVLKADINLVKEGTKVIFYKPDGAGSLKYKMMNNVIRDQQIVFDEADIAEVMNVNTITLPAETMYSYGGVRAVDKKGDYDTEFYLYGGQAPNESAASLNMYYPGAAFPEYKTNLTYGDTEATYYYSQVSDIPSAAFKKINADITSMTVLENKITIEISGSADVAIMSASHYSETESYFWGIYAPALNKGEWIVPQMPEELKTKYQALGTQAFKFRSAMLDEHTGLAKYNDFIQLTFQSTDFFESKVKETLSKNKTMIEEGGRTNIPSGYFDLYNSVGRGYGRRPVKMNAEAIRNKEK